MYCTLEELFPKKGTLYGPLRKLQDAGIQVPDARWDVTDRMGEDVNLCDLYPGDLATSYVEIEYVANVPDWTLRGDNGVMPPFITYGMRIDFKLERGRRGWVPVAVTAAAYEDIWDGDQSDTGRTYEPVDVMAHCGNSVTHVADQLVRLHPAYRLSIAEQTVRESIARSTVNA
jgi:hypothetical protein